VFQLFYLSNTKWQKTYDFLSEAGIPCVARNLRTQPFSYEEYLRILSLTQNGVEDILTVRGVVIDRLEKQGIHIEALSLRQLYELLMTYPNLLKLPLLTDYNQFAVGLLGAKDLVERQGRLHKEGDVRVLLS